MPYSPDRARVEKHLRSYWPSGKVPDEAVRQFVHVYNSVMDSTGDEGRAIASGKAVVKRRRLSDSHARRSAAMLAACMTPGVLKELESAARTCGCGRGHEAFADGLRAAQHTALYARNETDDKGERVDMTADMEFVWKQMAKSIYRSHDALILAIRELWQNSRDAGATRLDITWRQEGSRGTLTFVDNGHGMTAEVYKKVFTNLGGSKKPGGALGGFGAAKAAILAAGETWNWEIRSQNWVATSAEFGSSTFKIVAGQNLKGVTTILRDINARHMESALGAGYPMERIEAFIGACDLRGMHITLNGEQLLGAWAGRRGKREEDFERGWGDGIKVQIKSYAREDGNGSIYIRLGGIFQFAYERPAGIEYKRDYIVDMDIVDPTIVPKTPKYPFTPGRDDWEYDTQAWRAYRRMVRTLDEKGTKKSRDLGPYETVAPGSNDRREQEAQAKFDEMLNEVLSSEDFAEMFSNIGKATKQFYDGAYGAIPEAGVYRSEAEKEGEVSPLQGTEGGGPRGGGPVLGSGPQSEETPANPYSFWEQVNVAEPKELVGLLRGWLVSVTGGLSSVVRYALEDMEDSYGEVSGLEYVMEAVKEAMKRDSEFSSDLASAAALAKIGKKLATLMRGGQQEEIKKTLAELNPFGGAAIIKISNERYNKVKPDGTLDRTRSQKFRRSGAKKYMKHLVLWDFVVRQVLAAMAYSDRNEMKDLKLAGLGFVLDDGCNGLTSEEGGRGGNLYVMVNPEILDGVIQSNKERPWVIANFVHGLACHELAHATRIQGSHHDDDHNEPWSVIREDAAKATSWLLPAIAAAARELFRGVHKWTGRSRSKPADAATSKELEETKKKLAEVSEERDSWQDRAMANARDIEYMQRDYDLLKSETNSYLDTIKRLEAYVAEGKRALEEAEQARVFFKEKATPIIHRLEMLARLQDFKQMLIANPEMVAPIGVSLERVLEVLSEPGAMMKVLEIGTRGRL